jgi:hypothetical protein
MKSIVLYILTAALAAAQSPDTVEAFYRSGGPGFITARAGETLFHIAARAFGDPYKASTLQKLNSIEDPLKVEEGRKIRLPAGKRGILYSFHTLEDDCDVAEVTENYRFHNGDRFQFRMAANFEGYLYLYNQTGDNRLEQIYPGKSGRGRPIQAFRDYVMPEQDWFRFDSGKSPEELLVLISQEPLNELDRDLVADNAARASLKSYMSQSSDKGIVIDSGSGDRGRSLVLTSPVEGTKVFAHRIILKKQP